eukprot:6267802-Amphidinium_carterae.1
MKGIQHASPELQGRMTGFLLALQDSNNQVDMLSQLWLVTASQPCKWIRCNGGAAPEHIP